MPLPQPAIYQNLFKYSKKYDTSLDPSIFQKNDIEIQKKLAPILKQIAIKHLATAKTPAAMTFRGDHLQVTGQAYQDYLQAQSKSGAWGTDIEAVALAEALELNVVVTSVYKDRTDATWCLHLQDTNLPTIQLYNYGDYHWTNGKDSSTIGDGNCLYNAFAKGLKELVAPKQQSTPLTSNSVFQAGSSDKAVLESQLRINNAISRAVENHQTPTEKKIAYAEEVKRIESLQPDVQEQIANDYAYALKLAREEMLSVKGDIDIADENIQPINFKM